MGERAEDVKRNVLMIFPKLIHDKDLKITSKSDTAYNCIAWAYNINNLWMWPNTGEYPFLDGVHFWPSSEIMDTNVQNFIDAFNEIGYEICEKYNFEIDYRKIALYVVPGTTACTHAARQLRNGLWTSKLGMYCDIQHGTPETIENNEYGKVYCIMRKKF